MRKTTIVALLILLVGAGVGALVFLGPTLGRGGEVRKLANAFMEDLQFKDFRSSSLYTHKLERDRVDIGHALERLFMIKPEMVDIREFKIIKAEIDDERRARVLIRTVLKRLNMKKEPEEMEVVLYFIKRHPDCPIGATCNASGTCLNEFGKPARRLEEKEKKELDKKKPKTKEEKMAYEAAIAKGETFACAPEAEEEWYMNLDSTLKEKKYNN